MVNQHHPRRRHRIALSEQLRRASELDAIRLERCLTPAEQAEADNLADRAYMRQWRAQQRLQEAIITIRMIAPTVRTSGPRNAGGAA